MNLLRLTLKKTIGPIEHLLDGYTMYTVILYALVGLILYGVGLSAASILSFAPSALAASVAVIMLSATLMHYILAYVSDAPANLESTLITAMILALILTPSIETTALAIHATIGAGAILLKYVIVYRHRHLFNPAALVLVIAGTLGYIGVEWWVGSRYMLIPVLIAGAAVAIKTRRVTLVSLYIALSTAVVTVLGISNPLGALSQHFLSWPTVFFATIMLTEPLSLPGTRRLQHIYVALVSLVSTVPFSIGTMYGTPELALLVGNVFTFLATFPARLRLTFTKREEVGKGMYEYYFATPYPQRHKAGQYYEWTLPHLHPDSRGIRRYFTISSAPIGNEVSFAVKHVDQQSTWKTALANLQPGDAVFAAQLSGDFTLEDPGKPVVWIAGGIGITPFISMIRAAQHANLTLNATLFYCNRTEQDIAFKAEIAHAAQNGLTTVHFLNDAPPQSTFLHEIGYITPELVKTHAPHWQQATFYISGPPSLVESYERMLLHMGLPAHRVITDYFPGLA